MAKASKSVVINVAPETFYGVIIDFDKYPQFIKDMKEVRIDKAEKNEWIVTFWVSIIKKVEYTLNLKGIPGKELTWSLTKKGFMKTNDGGWYLKEIGKNKTEATYTVDVDLGLFAPKSVVNMLISTSFPAMLKNFKDYAESL